MKAPVKICNVFRSIDVQCGNPIVLFVGVLVAQPFHIVPELFRRVLEPPINFRIYYLFDFVVRFAVNNFYGRRRWLFTLRERIRRVRFELRNMEYRMNAFQRLRESDGIGSRARFTDYFVGSEMIFGEFLRGSGGPEVFCGDEDIVTDFYVRVRTASLISRFFIALLSKSNLLPEILVKTLKINGVILRIHVSDIAFRININCRVIAFIREKRRDAGGGTRCIIESEFGRGRSLSQSSC